MNDAAPVPAPVPASASASAPATRRARVRAPELVGKGGWLNTGGDDLTLAELRGKIVLLDF